jgi:hypothetical protein
MKEEKNETKKGSIVFLVFGGIFLSLAAVFLYFGLWFGLCCYAGGLIMTFLDLSYLRYKLQTDAYVIHAILVSGAASVILGASFLPPNGMFNMLMGAASIGVLDGGLGNLIMTLSAKYG